MRPRVTCARCAGCGSLLGWACSPPLLGVAACAVAHIIVADATCPCCWRLQVELKSGEIYRGELHEAEDNWNVQLTNVAATARDGKVRLLCRGVGPEESGRPQATVSRFCLSAVAVFLLQHPAQLLLCCRCWLGQGISRCATWFPLISPAALSVWLAASQVTHMEHIFIRGSRVRFIIVPDMLKNAPMFKRIDPKASLVWRLLPGKGAAG